MNAPGLDARALRLMGDVFARHPELAGVKLFGSRAKGTHHAASDVDLALWGDLDPVKCESISAELDDLPLPYRFETALFDQIAHPELREHIERVGIPIYARAAAHPSLR